MPPTSVREALFAVLALATACNSGSGSSNNNVGGQTSGQGGSAGQSAGGTDAGGSAGQATAGAGGGAGQSVAGSGGNPGSGGSGGSNNVCAMGGPNDPVTPGGDMQPPLRFSYALDGAETTNAVMMGRGTQEQRSRARWLGDTLVITTTHTFPHPETGQPAPVDVTQALSLAAPDSLVVVATRAGVLGGQPSTTRTVYRRIG